MFDAETHRNYLAQLPPIADNPLVDNLLHVGVAQTAITPPIGFTISGPEFADTPALNTEDDLFARCLVLKSYDNTVALVSLDVWAISHRLSNQIKHTIREVTGIPRQNIIIIATGNGTSPPLWHDDANIPTQYRNYIAYLPDIIAGAVLEAAISLKPAASGTISTTLPNLSCFAKPNQQEYLETERETLQLTVIQTSDNRIACLLYNFACPATIVGNTQSWTADYPGVASGALENAGIGNAIFIQGASADIRPFDWWDGNSNISHPERSMSDAYASGILLATQAIRSAPNAITRRNATVKTATSETGEITALRIGDATLVATEQPHPAQFAVDIRAALPDTKLLISTNSIGIAQLSDKQRADTRDTFAKTIELVKQSGIYP